MLIAILTIALMAKQDYKHGFVEDQLQIQLMAILVFFDMTPYIKVTAIFFIFAMLLYEHVQKYVGGADVKLLIILTAFYGPLILVVTFISSFIGLVYSLIRKKRKIRFIPFIFLGVIIVEVLKFIF